MDFHYFFSSFKHYVGGCAATFLYECPRAAPAPLVIFLVLQDQYAYIKHATIDTDVIVIITGVSHGINSYRLSVALSAAVWLIASAYTGRPRYKHNEAVFWVKIYRAIEVGSCSLVLIPEDTAGGSSRLSLLY